IGFVQRGRGADSWEEQGGGIEATFRVPREPVTQWPREKCGYIGEIMSIRKCFLWQISCVVSILLLTTIQPLAAESASESKRIEELERTVAELKKEVAELK